MHNINIIFPHQLIENNPLFSQEGAFYLIEEYLFFNQYKFHKQKIAFHRATMKYYENYLKSNGRSVQYIQSTEKESDIRIFIQEQSKKGVKKISIIDPEDDWLIKRIQSSCAQFNLNLQILDSPLFLNTKIELQKFFKPEKKKFFQTEFYKQERIKRNILIDAFGNPEGNQWTFDTENRKKYPTEKTVNSCHFPSPNPYTIEAQSYVAQNYPNNIGILGHEIQYPTSHKESKEWLTQFLKNRLTEFGDYEDAIVQDELVLNHSLLTPMLNVGLITPQQILDETLKYSAENRIPINSLEGFVRQIIGWREFIRGVYVTKGIEERSKNYWGFQRKIPQSFYDGTTGILPIDETIQKILKTGYCHHIERLMILGNFMLLCEFDPNEVYKWFMEFFIDAYDWVMVPNVYGMSQFADGGLMSTKPYISGSNYVIKMSNYPKGEWQLTWDALFWRFMNTHREFFLHNPRLGMLVKSFDKWDENKKSILMKKANNFLFELDK